VGLGHVEGVVDRHLSGLDHPGIDAGALRGCLGDLERAVAEPDDTADELVEPRGVHVEDDVGLGVRLDVVVDRHEVHGMLLRAVALGARLGDRDRVELLPGRVGVGIDVEARDRGDHGSHASPR
jgi:hypothetical protein